MLSRLLRCVAFFLRALRFAARGPSAERVVSPLRGSSRLQTFSQRLRAGLNNFAPSGLAFFCIQLFVVCTQLLCLSLDMKTLGGRKMFKKVVSPLRGSSRLQTFSQRLLAGLNNFAPSGLAFFCIQLFVVCTQLLCLSL